MMRLQSTWGTLAAFAFAGAHVVLASCSSDSDGGDATPSTGGVGASPQAGASTVSGGAPASGNGGTPGASGGTIQGGSAGTPSASGGTAGSGTGGAPLAGSGGLSGADQGGMPAAGAGGSGGTLSAGGTAGAGAGAGSPSGYVPPPATRSGLPLNEGWRFLRSDAQGASDVDFDDGDWQTLSLPHTWNAQDGQDGGDNYYQGIGWYRTHYELPADAAGKRVYLQFDGANIVSDVYVNGTSLGQHRGGFARFRFDATAALVPGDNVIAVRVNNTEVNDVAPLEADFTFFGGLYRPAHVLVTDALHIDTEDYASSGAYFSTSNVSAASADLTARIRVRNDGSGEQAVSVTSVVVGADGAVAATLTASGNVGAGAGVELSANATLQNPHLWNGRADPYVYTVYVELRAGDVVVDWLSEPLGVRSFGVDAAAGFSLNESYLDLRGVNRHQDRQGLGWAVSSAEHDEDMALIEELGANVVRLAHYQHAQYFHELADRAGMVLWAEIPLVNRITDSAAFRDNARQQLLELIRQNYNHPSILFWGIGNEQRTDDSATNSLLDDLAELARAEDPGRLVTYAQCCTSDTGGLPAHSDVVGYNTYYGWYDAFGAADEFGAWADGLHAARPDWKIGISEYGAGASVVQHAESPAQPDPYGTPHPEEWQNLVHETHWKQMSTRPYLWSKIIWNMFDFAVDSRDEGDTAGRNDKGLVSYDRQTKKDAFFWYKANWTTAPLVYISSRRYTPRASAAVSVKVYANTPSVELFVNEESRGSQSSTDHIFTWMDVPLDLGDNEIEARGSEGGATDSVSWTRM